MRSCWCMGPASKGIIAGRLLLLLLLEVEDKETKQRLPGATAPVSPPNMVRSAVFASSAATWRQAEEGAHAS